MYGEFKKQIGAFYLTPLEIFSKTFPSLNVSAEELTVISWVLPQTEATKKANQRETRFPSERWARSRKYAEEFYVKLHDYVVSVLQKAGCEAVAPSRTAFWAMKVSGRYGLSSTWSERHAAYVAGLGTFGLCDGLITPAEKAIRCGSVIARIAIPASPRPYNDHHAYCLFFSKKNVRDLHQALSRRSPYRKRA